MKLLLNYLAIFRACSFHNRGLSLFCFIPNHFWLRTSGALLRFLLALFFNWYFFVCLFKISFWLRSIQSSFLFDVFTYLPISVLLSSLRPLIVLSNKVNALINSPLKAGVSSWSSFDSFLNFFFLLNHFVDLIKIILQVSRSTKLWKNL